MSTTLQPSEALALVPGLQASAFRIEAMSGGLTNRVYKLIGDKATYVLRLNAEHTDAFGLDRSREIDILAQAAAAGLAAEVVHADVNRGILLLRYVDGRVWTSQDLAEPKNLERLGGLLRQIHALPASGKVFDAIAVAAAYVGNLQSHPDLHAFGTRCRSIIASVAATENPCCCHNDVVAANVIATPGLMLLDWEYACDNEPLFDLASVISYHELDSGHADILLSAYAGGATPELRERLAAQIRLYGALHWLWLASRQVASPNPAQAKGVARLRRSLM